MFECQQHNAGDRARIQKPSRISKIQATAAEAESEFRGLEKRGIAVAPRADEGRKLPML